MRDDCRRPSSRLEGCTAGVRNKMPSTQGSRTLCLKTKHSRGQICLRFSRIPPPAGAPCSRNQSGRHGPIHPHPVLPGQPPRFFLKNRRTVSRQQTISQIPMQKTGQPAAALGLPGMHTLMRQQSRLPTGIPPDKYSVPQSHANRLTPIKIPTCRQPLHPAESWEGNLVHHEDPDALGTAYPAPPGHCQLNGRQRPTAPHGTPFHPPRPRCHPGQACHHSGLYQNPTHFPAFLCLTPRAAIGEISRPTPQPPCALPAPVLYRPPFPFTLSLPFP
jgi:hypothetical protein